MRHALQGYAGTEASRLNASAEGMQSLQVFDARMMRKLAVLRGHQADVTCAAWHPWHEDLLASGSYDGSILHWLASHPSQPQVPTA